MKDPAQSPAQTLHSPKTEGTETLAAFSRRLGVARSTVTRAAQAGRLVLVQLDDGTTLVRIAESLALWQASRGGRDDVAQRHAEGRGAAIPLPGLVAQPAAPATASATPPQAAGAAGSRAQHQATVLHWQNQLLDLQLQLQRGHQLPADAVLNELQGLGATLRGLAERLVDQLAPRLAVAASRADRERLLAQELTAARRQIRHEYPRALRRVIQQACGTTQQEASP